MPTITLPSRPRTAAALIGVGAQALFSYRVTTPSTLMFDETHYVPAARTLLSLGGPANVEHPLLAKELIAAGIALFGDDSLGWRAFSTVAGTGIVLAVFWMVWLMFGRVRTAVIGAVLAVLNFTVFVQARIGMLDGFMAAFLLLGIAASLWAMRGTERQAWPRWVLGSALLGLAVAAKWAAVPFVAYAAAGFVAVRLLDARAQGRSVYAALNAGGQRHWAGMAAVPAIVVLGAVSVGTYFLTFAPAFFYHFEPMTMGDLLPFQARMYAQQTQILPPHTYQSSWWSWPLMVRPIWYLYEQVDGAQRGVLLLGNPLILWAGLVAVAACLWAGFWDRSPKMLAAAGLWIGAYLPWVVIPKSIGFFYYYFVPSILLCVALATALDHFPRARRWDEGFVVAAAALFAWFYPILSAARLAGPGSFQHWMWFPSWP